MVDSNFASIITPIKMVVKSASLAVNIEQFWPFLTSSYFIYEQSYHLCSASQMMVLTLVVAAMEKKSERKLLKRKVGHWCKRKENIYTLEANIQPLENIDFSTLVEEATTAILIISQPTICTDRPEDETSLLQKHFQLDLFLN